MQPYNVEIFDRSFNLIQHYNVDDIEYDFDYLSTVENSILIAFDSNVKKGQYIRIQNNKYEYFGYISAIAVDEEIEGYSEIKFKPFISLFDVSILFDVTLQGSGTSLEQMIANVITNYFISNADTDQNINGLTVETISTTSTWDFHIVASEDGLNYTIVNFMSALIRKSLTKYQVGLYVIPDFENQSIKVQIGVKNATAFYVEADLPSILEKSIIVNENVEDTNKLVIYDQTNMQTNLIYYKHTDGTYSTTNTDRITPVVFNTVSVTYSSDSTFAAAALEAASQQFDTDSYNNLIELSMLDDDTLVSPDTLSIGQLVNVIANGVTYASILTGFERREKTKLVFGTLRLDLTKILKERS